MSVAVVVLPLVPVTPTRRSFEEGLPYQLEASMPRAMAVFATTTSVAPSGISAGISSTTMAAGFLSASVGMKEWPSTVTPRTATNMAPSPAFLESEVREVTFLSSWPWMEMMSRPSSNCSSFTLFRIYLFSLSESRPVTLGWRLAPEIGERGLVKSEGRENARRGWRERWIVERGGEQGFRERG